MKTQLLAVGLGLLFAPTAMAQTADELAKGSAADTSNVLNYGMGYDLNRFSPLKQINKDNVKHLVPVWNYSYDDNRSEESQPLVYKGVLYVTTNSATMAIDAKTGRQIWKTKVEYPPETPRIVCCGIIPAAPPSMTARSSAPRSTPSSRSMPRPARNCGARTRSTSRPDPSSMAGIPRGVSICGAPTRSPDRASPAVTPGRETPGRMGAARPGSPARSIPSCTPCTGASAIRVRSMPPARPRDNLYTCSVLALDPKTGKIKWHNQFSPNNPFD